MKTKTMNEYICLGCKEHFTDEELEELRDMGEPFSLVNNHLLCPDCYDNFMRKSAERQFELLLGAWKEEKTMSNLKETLFRNALFYRNAYHNAGVDPDIETYEAKFAVLLTVIDESGLTAEWKQYKVAHTKNKEVRDDDCN